LYPLERPKEEQGKSMVHNYLVKPTLFSTTKKRKRDKEVQKKKRQELKRENLTIQRRKREDLYKKNEGRPRLPMQGRRNTSWGIKGAILFPKGIGQEKKNHKKSRNANEKTERSKKKRSRTARSSKRQNPKRKGSRGGGGQR